MAEGRVAVITGASSGIGAATAVALHRAGFRLVLGARRLERVKAVGEPLGALCLPLDVTELESIEAFCAQIPEVNVLVNNAGGAWGRAARGPAAIMAGKPPASAPPSRKSISMR